MSFFQIYTVHVDSVALSYPYTDSSHYLVIKLEVFPSSGDSFNRSEISDIGFAFSNQTYKPPKQTFGPYFFIGDYYEIHAGDSSTVDLVST